MTSENEKKLEIIKQAYFEFYETFVDEGNVPAKHTLEGAGYWAMADPQLLFDFFELIELDKFSKFIDLGSGDGCVIAVASLFLDSLGVELDNKLFNQSKKVIGQISNKLELNKIKIEQKDFLEMDLGDYDFVFINPDNYLYQLEGKLQKELKKGTKIVVMNNLFLPLNLNLLEKIMIGGMDFRVYGV